MRPSPLPHRLIYPLAARAGFFSRAALAALLGFSAAGPAQGAAPPEADLKASILLAKPAVVLILSEVRAEVDITCGSGATRTVAPEPQVETGSGFIIHPDGFIATNGHVVERYYEMNEPALMAEFVAAATRQACGDELATLPDGARRERFRAIAGDPRNRRRVRLAKSLRVYLSNGKTYAAAVRAYSPAINPAAPPAGRAASGGAGPLVERSGKDVAILKITEQNLPTVRLAPTSAGLLLGGQIFIIGYPGVVLHHDFLSQKSRLESSVTVGRVSGFKLDIGDRRVIQTDAAITWGNSGGPAFNPAGEVIGAATFISLTSEGDQAVQGFNFLIPVETVHEFARQIDLTPRFESPFRKDWESGVGAFFTGRYRRSLASLESAERIMPGFPDVQRLRTAAQLKIEEAPAFSLRQFRFGLGLLAGAGLALLAVGARSLWRRRRNAERRVRRIAPEDLFRRLQIGERLTVLDARQGQSFAASPLQVAGALRMGGESLPAIPYRLEVESDGQVVLYCDCPDEATSARLALELMRMGHGKVSVVRGGFPALLDSGIPVEAKETTPPPGSPARLRPDAAR